ncbi:hypothetical protein UlMin_035213 [Ulmus minor]
MVSVQAPLSPKQSKAIPEQENSSKKRKFELEYDFGYEQIFGKRSNSAESKKFLSGMELQLETPLPSEWQRCLDIQSGKIHFYNSKTNTRTSKDPRSTLEPPSCTTTQSDDHILSLDLELNLTCDQSIVKKNQAEEQSRPASLANLLAESTKQKKNSNPSWLSLEAEEEEMVASVCLRCHMLVMLCKSSPACPNCKFMHTLDQTPPPLFKSRPCRSFLCK